MAFVCSLYAQEYRVLGIGDSSIQYMFGFTDIVRREIPLQDNTTGYITAYIKAFPGKTMYGSKKISFSEIIPADLIDSVEAIIFDFGTVDTLFHIAKQASAQNTSIEQIIENLMPDYFSNILHVKETYPDYQGKIIIMTPIPPLYNSSCSPEPVETKVKIHKLFNAALEKNAYNHSFLFLNPYASCTTSEGLLDDLYDANDGVHMNHAYYYILVAAAYTLLQQSI